MNLRDDLTFPDAAEFAPINQLNVGLNEFHETGARLDVAFLPGTERRRRQRPGDVLVGVDVFNGQN